MAQACQPLGEMSKGTEEPSRPMQYRATSGARNSRRNSLPSKGGDHLKGRYPSFADQKPSGRFPPQHRRWVWTKLRYFTTLSKHRTSRGDRGIFVAPVNITLQSLLDLGKQATLFGQLSGEGELGSVVAQLV